MTAHALTARIILMLMVFAAITLTCSAAPLCAPDGERFTPEMAERMIGVTQGLLAPVYAPLADQIVSDYNLAEKESGIGIDLGGGPGSLILELCARTTLYWINADVNPHVFSWFFARAEDRGLGHRVGAVFADGQALPFRDDYADIIVSRGTYHFINDRQRAFSEIYRVLKPGGVAYIGRGFARDMPVETARAIREKQGETMVYDREAAADELRQICEALNIAKYRIETPDPPGEEDLSYGIWIEIRKPLP